MNKKHELKNSGDNNEFFEHARSDAVQQEIYGEARFLRGLFGAIHKCKSIGIFAVGTGVAMFLFLVATISFSLTMGAISAAIEKREYDALIIAVSFPGILTFIFYFLSIKVIRNLFAAIRERSGTFQVKAGFVFFVLALLTLLILFSVLSSFANIHFIW